MRETQPQVWLVAEPHINWDVLREYVVGVDGAAWYDRVADGDIGDAEVLTEAAGRLCYRSWVPGLNANVTRVREDSEAYLGNILAQKHGAVLEHGQFTFIFQDVSRVFTHELVRHRAGVAISQESLRYVRLTDIGMRLPGALRDPRLEPRIITLVEQMEEFQRDAADILGLDDDDVPFHEKKIVTSALRRLAPLGLSTSIMWSANVRTLRHVIQLRTARAAEEEMRIVFHEVGLQLRERAPFLLQDFDLRDTVDGVPEWVPTHEKV